MANASVESKVIKPAQVIPEVVEETFTLELTRDEAEEIFSLVANTNAQNKTFNVYQALSEAFSGNNYPFCNHDSKHTVSFDGSLIQLKAK